MSVFRKATVGAVTAAIGAAVTAYPDGFTNQEIGTVVAAFFVAGLAVYQIKNVPSTEVLKRP